MKSLALTAIRSQSPSVYELVFKDGGEQLVFEMRVEDGDIELIVAEDAFDQHVLFSTGCFAPIFEAVRAFHRATRVPFPSDAAPPLPGSTPPAR